MSELWNVEQDPGSLKLQIQCGSESETMCGLVHNERIWIKDDMKSQIRIRNGMESIRIHVQLERWIRI